MKSLKLIKKKMNIMKFDILCINIFIIFLLFLLNINKKIIICLFLITSPGFYLMLIFQVIKIL